MCVIIIAEKRKMTKEEFTEAFNFNDDGVGFAWVKDNKVHFRKGFMTLDEAWAAYGKVKVLPHVVHFRKASAGAVCPELTHPFLCDGTSPLAMQYDDEGTILFHNGTVGGWRDMLMTLTIVTGQVPEGPVSDSRVVAMYVARVGLEGFERVAPHLFSQGNRWVMVTPQGISFMGEFSEDNGIMASNSTYKPRAFGSWSGSLEGSSGKAVPKPKKDQKPKKTHGKQIEMYHADDEQFMDYLNKKYYGHNAYDSWREQK